MKVLGKAACFRVQNPRELTESKSPFAKKVRAGSPEQDRKLFSRWAVTSSCCVCQHGLKTSAASAHCSHGNETAEG